MNNMILDKAAEKIAKFNNIGLHYNLVADAIYKKRFESNTNPFNQSYFPYIVAGLISFDIGRFIGVNEDRYLEKNDNFAHQLKAKLKEIKPYLTSLANLDLTEVDLQKERQAIINAYDILATKNGLHSDKTKHFHVGATKILHFLNPELFIIVDSYARIAFKMANKIQARHSADLYIKRLEHARKDILYFGLNRFKHLEQTTPITRIYDKLTFMTGYKSVQDSRVKPDNGI